MKFWKYQANGNDFVIFDDRKSTMDKDNKKLFRNICDRKYGIGADGILFLESSPGHDFKMTYLNADGGEVDMCGNGARAIVDLASKLLAKKPFSFETKKGIYEGEVLEDGTVCVSMNELYDVESLDVSDLYSEAKNSYFANTGVPHCVYQVEDVNSIDLVSIARPIRSDHRFSEGTNVNFYEVQRDKVKMRTYERGVEDETLACGTGTIAVALSYVLHHGEVEELSIETPGGLMKVQFRDKKRFLIGNVSNPFTGEIEISNFL
ncbi:MAG: diaminopimelate epimerase [Bacteriovoracaceae bacterium]|nr:diaminopimelate epimerase [Bacteriovoracaceae bacterium]